MSRTFHIGLRRLGPDDPVYVVAELSANHAGSLDTARRAVEAAKAAGADAVKVQTYTADTLTIDCDAEPFRISGTLWDGRTLYDLYTEASMPWEWHEPLQDAARDVGIDFFSTAFDDRAVGLLERLDVPVHKVASFELVDLELVATLARTGRPLILSTGMATVEEIHDAVGTARAAGADELLLLKCTSAYPSPPGEMRLRAIPDLANRFDVPVGLSDHTLGETAAIAAVALGAVFVEKHFTLDRSLGGPDASFSLEPDELAALVRAIRETEAAAGPARYGPTEHERESLVFRRSLFVVADVAAGEPLTRDNVRAIRPGYGLAPKHLPDVLGRTAARDLRRGTPIDWDMLA